MTTCQTCGQPTDQDNFVTLVSINGNKQKLLDGTALLKPYVRYERRKVFFEVVPIVCVVDREDGSNDSITEDHRVSLVVPGMGDHRLEMVNLLARGTHETIVCNDPGHVHNSPVQEVYGLYYRGHRIEVTDDGGRWNVRVNGDPLKVEFGLSFDEMAEFVDTETR